MEGLTGIVPTRAFPSLNTARLVYGYGAARALHLNRRYYTMLPVDEAIVDKLRNDGPCCFDEVVTGLPKFSWGQIFVAVDCMSRDGRVRLRQLGSATYEMSLGSDPAYSSSTSSDSGQTAGTEMLIPQRVAH